jgi:hypothetical protein
MSARTDSKIVGHPDGLKLPDACDGASASAPAGRAEFSSNSPGPSRLTPLDQADIERAFARLQNQLLARLRFALPCRAVRATKSRA